MGHTILKIFKKIMPHIGPLSASKNSKGAFSKMTLPGSQGSSLQKMGRKFIHLSPSQQNLKKRTQVCTFSNRPPNPESGKDHLKHPDFRVAIYQITEIKLQSTTGHGSFGKWLVCDGNYHEHQPFM